MVFVYAFSALLLAFVLTPPVIAVSWRIGALDVPKDLRRMHRRSIPRAGGLAVFAAFAAVGIVWGGGDRWFWSAFFGGVWLLAVGLYDDLFGMDARIKLVMQTAAAAAAVSAGGERGAMSTLWAVLWVVTLTNAHNFIDGLDGLFTGCAAIEGVALFAAMLLSGSAEGAAPVLFLSMACLGLRYYNRHPAQTFSGDCGSGTVGFLLGMFSLPLFEMGDGNFSFLSPLLIFAYPLCDLAAAVLRRGLRGKSPFCADRGHLHHRICDAGLSQTQCVRVLSLLCAGMGVTGVFLISERLLLAAAAVTLLLAIILMRIRRFIEKFNEIG